mgnify:CR=1 FL=1
MIISLNQNYFEYFYPEKEGLSDNNQIELEKKLNSQYDEDYLNFHNPTIREEVFESEINFSIEEPDLDINIEDIINYYLDEIFEYNLEPQIIYEEDEEAFLPLYDDENRANNRGRLYFE